MKMKNDIIKYLKQYNELYSEELFINNSLDLNYVSSEKNKNITNYSNSINNFFFEKNNLNILFIEQTYLNKSSYNQKNNANESSKLFDKILSAIQLKRNNIYILNLLNYRYSQARSVTIKEINRCKKIFNKQLEIIRPKVIVGLGESISQTLLNTKDSLCDLRNKIYKYENIDLLPTYHPMELLADNNLKKDAWKDYKILKKDYINVR
mgnify:FL=1